MVPDDFLFPLTTANGNYRIRMTRFTNGNLCLLKLHATHPKLLGSLTEGKLNHPVAVNQCALRHSLGEQDAVVKRLIEFGILVTVDAQSNLYEVRPPTVVHVFHNINELFRVEGDEDGCSNQQYVAAVTVPVGEEPLEWAYRATNHIDSDWTKNPGVIAVGDRLRSTSVGDVMELRRYGEPASRYLVTGLGFKML